MTDHALNDLIKRLAEAQPSWLPIAGHVVNVTFTLNERDLLLTALKASAALAQDQRR